MDLLGRLARHFKVILALLALAFGMFWAGHEAYVGLRETKPTAYDVADVSRAYGGENWLRLTGRLAIEEMVVKRSTHEAHAGKDLAYAYVPLVPPGWHRGEPIHVLITIGPSPSGSIQSLVEARGRDPGGVVTIGGQVGRGLDREKFFPEVAFGQPFVWLNENDGPASAKTSIALLAVFSGLFVWALVVLVKGLREPMPGI